MRKSIYYAIAVAIMVAGITITACLCAKSVVIQRRAGVLNRAVLMAQNAAEAFYACDSAEKLASLVNGREEEGCLVCEDEALRMTIVLEYVGLHEFRAKITVFESESEIVYSLDCIRYSEDEIL